MRKDLIRIHNKVFKRFINERIIRERVERLALEMSDDLKDKNPLFLCVLNGSFIFAADLVREFDFPCKISFVKLTSYIQSKSTGKVQEIIGLQESLKGRNVVVIEDIVDTGNTLESLMILIKKQKPASIKTVCLFFKPEVYKKSIPIAYIGFEIPEAFIVGYGLDYDGEGRNLKSIYSLYENNK